MFCFIIVLFLITTKANLQIKYSTSIGKNRTLVSNNIPKLYKVSKAEL
jgi:hypothetical protein